MRQERAHRSADCWCGHGGFSHYAKGEERASACKECERGPMLDPPATPMLVEDRRRFERFGLSHPIRTSVGSAPAYVIDASIAGLGVVHHEPAPPVGTACRLMFYSQFGAITLRCEVVRTLAGDNGSPGETTFQTGLRIVAADAESESRLRALVMALAVGH